MRRFAARCWPVVYMENGRLASVHWMKVKWNAPLATPPADARQSIAGMHASGRWGINVTLKSVAIASSNLPSRSAASSRSHDLPGDTVA